MQNNQESEEINLDLYELLVLKIKKKKANFWEMSVVQNVCMNVHLRISLCAWYVSGIREVALIHVSLWI